jgi:hypothetical protein
MLYLREDAIITPIDRFLRYELTGAGLARNLRSAAAAQDRGMIAPTPRPVRSTNCPRRSATLTANSVAI